MPTAVEPIFVDTNVLLDATDLARPRHSLAVAALERHPALVMGAQIAREYLVVCTRPVEANGLGLALPDALENLSELRAAVRMLPEDRPLLPGLLSLLAEVPCLGKAIHDAAVVAAMLAHGVRELLTSNPAHFDRFAAIITVRSLPDCLVALGVDPEDGS